MNGLRLVSRMLLALAVLHLSACSTLTAVSVESALRDPPPPGVDYGSLVSVQRIDGERLRFRVTEMNDEGLGGAPGFVRYEDMRSLRVQSERDGSRALGWIAGVVGVLALFALAGSADEVRVCNPGPCIDQ